MPSYKGGIYFPDDIMDYKSIIKLAEKYISKTIYKTFSKEEVESVGFKFTPYDDAVKKYDPKVLKDGYNTVDGEEIYYISNPALGLWTI